jgi:hypothetical protein
VSLEYIGHIGGGVDAIAIAQDVAFVGHGNRMILVRLIGAESLAQIAAVDLPGTVKHIAVGRDREAYVALESGEIYVCEAVGSPVSALSVVGSVRPPHSLSIAELALDGTLLYAAAEDAGLWIFDVDERTKPVAVATRVLEDLAVAAVAVSDSYAFVIPGSRAGFRVLDVSDPLAPREVASLVDPWPAEDIAVEGSQLYALGARRGLSIFDVANPSAPRLMSITDVRPGSNTGLVVAEGLAFVSASDAQRGQGGVVLLDVSDPTRPRELGSLVIPPGGIPGPMVYADGYLYEAGGGELRAIAVGNPQAPELAGSVAMMGLVYDVSVTDGLAYAAAGVAGLRIIDVADPRQLTEIGEARWISNATRVEATGNRVYVVDGGAYSGGSAFPADRLVAVDVSIAESPVLVGEVDLGGDVFELEMGGRHIYASVVRHGAPADEWQARTWVIETRAESELAIVGTVEPPGAGIAVRGDTLYSASTRLKADSTVVADIRVFDARDPALLRQLGITEIPGGVTAMAASTGVAYIINDRDGLHTVDVTNTGRPRPLGHLASPGSATSLASLDGYVAAGFVTNGGRGLRVFDVRQPEQPRLAATYGKFVNGVETADDHIYAASSFGVTVLRLSDSPVAPTPTPAQHNVGHVLLPALHRGRR